MDTQVNLWGVALLLLTYWGCRPTAEEDILPPLITLHQPVEAATYRPGDTVHINVVITENDELHLVGLNIFDQQTGLHAWESFIHRHTQKLDVVDFFLPPGQDSTTYQLRVAALDHHGNESLEISYFHIAPL